MAYPMIRARAHGGEQAYVWRIVMHATVSPCVRGGARANAAWFQNPAAGVSAHYVVDPGEVVQCLPENVVGYHDGRNVNEIGIELCDPQTGPGSRWADADHEAMLRLAAGLVRDVAKRWNVPLQRIRYDLTKPPTRGVCGHSDVSLTWRCSTHTDPGAAFPWAHFMDLVNGTAKPATQEDDLTPEQATQLADLHRVLIPGTDHVGDVTPLVYDALYFPLRYGKTSSGKDTAVSAILANQAALAAQVEALGNAGGVDAATLKAVADAARKATMQALADASADAAKGK